MGWMLGKDHIDRLYDPPYFAHVVLTSMRNRRQFEIFRDGVLVFRSGPYQKPRDAKKGAERKIRELNGKAQESVSIDEG